MQVDIAPDVLRSFAFFSSLLVMKMLSMSFLTAVQRFRKRVFANPEDIARDKKNLKVAFDDPDVERVRRAHMNDIENIMPFLTIGLLYCFTNPAVGTANFLFKAFTVARYLHTLVYAVVVVRQPARALLFAVGSVITFYMSYKVLTHFL